MAGERPALDRPPRLRPNLTGVDQSLGRADRTATSALTNIRHSQIQAHIAMAEWLTALVLGLLLGLAGGAGRVLLAGRCLADWNRAWRDVEPRWTRRR